MQSRFKMYPQYEEFRIWDEFLEKWPVERVENMTLEQYTNRNKSDSFTYWLESKTDEIVSIWGGSSYKFGIFIRDPNAEKKDLKSSQKSDGIYGWYTKYGNTALEAFENVKILILEVIYAAIKGEFYKIDDIDLGHAYKWKIAFMYSEPGQLPGIVSRQVLKYISEKYSCFGDKTSMILQCLMNKKPEEVDFWAFTSLLWKIWEDKDREETQIKPEGNNVDFKNLNVKNIITYGPPGVGKTHNTNKLIRLIEDGKSDQQIFKTIKRNERNELTDVSDIEERIKFITFHQSFGYEDFIEGFRPNEEGEIELSDGVFKEICESAENDRDNNYYLVVDEINRGNISKIFGELITLIEEDKRDCYEVTLPYSKEPFKVPSNLYIIGTMNSTDKSIALIDVALRRRFTFVKMEPNAELIEDRKARNLFIRLNEYLKERLGEDYRIGHSYFMQVQNDSDLKFVVEYKIKPLLEEYFYGDDVGRKRAMDILDQRSE